MCVKHLTIILFQRSALAYSSTYSGAESVCRRVHVGVSTSSTTSRSTNKTGSSPYRSDTHLRHTSTSTSNYNSDRDPYLSSRSHRSTLHPRPGTVSCTRNCSLILLLFSKNNFSHFLINFSHIYLSRNYGGKRTAQRVRVGLGRFTSRRRRQKPRSG